MILHGGVEINDLLSLVKELMGEEDEPDNTWAGIELSKFQDEDRLCGYPGRTYFEERGILEPAYERFGLGYSKAKDMVIVPVHDEHGELRGVVGRSIANKRYQYSTGLPRRDLIWNLHNAKFHDGIILTEGTLDSVYLWQAGFENVGAVFGSSVSDTQVKLLRKYFSYIVCFFDNDAAGEGLRDSLILAENLGLLVYTVEYPEDTKDPGDLTVEQIQHMIMNNRLGFEKLMSGELTR